MNAIVINTSQFFKAHSFININQKYREKKVLNFVNYFFGMKRIGVGTHALKTLETKKTTKKENKIPLLIKYEISQVSWKKW